MFSRLLVIFKDNNGDASGKKILGTLCIIVALSLTIRASYFCMEHLSEQAVLIAPVLAAGLTLWGISTMSTYFQDKINKPIPPTQETQDNTP